MGDSWTLYAISDAGSVRGQAARAGSGNVAAFAMDGEVGTAQDMQPVGRARGADADIALIGDGQLIAINIEMPVAGTIILT